MVKASLLLLTVVLTSLLVEGCLPDNNNQCGSHGDCCSGNCWRGNANWATGVCKPGGGLDTIGGGAAAGERGICSWYGAPGEIPEGFIAGCNKPFHRNELAVAHRTLPCGTRIRVTNLNNQRSVVVRVNDRGPKVPGRILDLTYGAFGNIAPHGQGVVPCSYTIL